MDCQDDMGRTALHFAIQNGNTSVIEELVKHGADVNARDASDITPLCMIIMYRDYLDIPSSACPVIKKVLVLIQDCKTVVKCFHSNCMWLEFMR